MFNFRVYTKKDGAYNNKIDGVAVFPLSIGELLDEQLDEAHLTIKLSHTEHFEPLTDVRIELLQDGVVVKNLYMIIASDNSFEFPIGKGTYTHNLYLIERTKLLEGTLCQSITFTNSLGNTFTKGAFNPQPLQNSKQEPYHEWQGEYLAKIDTIVNPIEKGIEFTTPTPREIFNKINPNDEYNLYLSDYYLWEKGYETKRMYSSVKVDVDGKTTSSVTDEYSGDYRDQSITFIPGELNTITYDLAIATKTGTGAVTTSVYLYQFKYTLNGVSNRYPLKPYTITDCINRVLELAETILLGETPRYTLNDAQATEFDKIKAPEFTMTQCTLREQLKIIGNYIHAEVRLGGYDANGVYKPNQIFFDKYGQTNKTSLANAPYVYRGQKQDISQYCTDVQTNASNIVNSLNYAQGVVIEPDISNTKTLRTESINLKLTESTSKVMTQLPIYKITKVECGLYDDNGDSLVGIVDITPYVFEAHEYFSTLSSYEGAYPYAKTYAIYYTQGEKGLDGLFFKPESALNPVWKNYAITNILNAATGQNEGNKTFEDHFPTLCFRVSYLPIYEAKFSHNKQLVIPSSKKFSQVYNQSDNLIETSYYGENIKGVAQRLGNVEQTRTYYLHNIDGIPKVQDSIDGFVISAVNTELLWGYIKCTVALSKGFNRISQYVGINSNKRIAEVSEKQAYKRDILIKEYVVLGNFDEQKDMENSKIFKHINSVYQTFIPDTENKIKLISACVFSPYSNADKKAIVQPLKLPVVSSAFGNSLVFSFAFKDNYSAGEQIQVIDSSLSPKPYWQTDTPYCNYYGRIKYADVMLLNDIENKGLNQANTPTYLGEDDSIIKSEQPYLIRKDSREILSFNFEVEFVTTRSDCIIGSALASFNPLVTTSDRKPQVRFYNRKIGAFETIITDDKYAVGSMARIGNEIAIYFPDATMFESWAIVMPVYNEKEQEFEDEDGNVIIIKEKKGGEVLFICNKSVVDYGDITNDFINISLKHKIYNK
jgi:hypothetical protein